jgi:hypothetical protein
MCFSIFHPIVYIEPIRNKTKQTTKRGGIVRGRFFWDLETRTRIIKTGQTTASNHLIMPELALQQNCAT